MKDEIKIIETTGYEVVEAQQRAEIDTQIATAKAYPRDLRRVKDDSIAIVTMSKETAESCRYVLPRAGKNISGGSVHLARILAQQYGNIRVDSKIKAITATEIISEGVAFDLQTNYAVKVEVRKSILQNEYKDGQRTGKKVRMNDDMVTVIGNAANAISFRNAVFAIVPKSIIDACFNASIEAITGDLSNETKLISARKKALAFFKDNYKADEDAVLKALSLNSVNQINAEQIANLRGFMQALKDGDVKAESLFPVSVEQKKEKLRGNKNDSTNNEMP